MSRTQVDFLEGLAQNSWRIFKVISELVQGFECLNDTKTVAIFGTARESALSQEEKEDVEMIAARIAKKGYSIVTGGGPGVMLHANKGATEQGGVRSLGFTVEGVEDSNQYATEKVKFHYFFTRKLMFLKNASAVVVCPGGFGTFDELFEVLTLIQTQCNKKIPVIIYGKFYEGLIEWIKNSVVKRGFVSEKEYNELIKYAPNVTDAFCFLDSLL